jgi:biopolymer transport protein ExbD
VAFSFSGGNGSRSGLGRRRFGASNGTLSEINIVPLVDVVLVLLIIFMLTAHVMEFGLEINVPEVKQVQDTAEELPVINVTRDGKLFLNEKPVNINQIPEEVARRFKGAKAVYLLADRSTVWDPIVQVISTLNEAKIQIKVVAKPEDTAARR